MNKLEKKNLVDYNLTYGPEDARKSATVKGCRVVLANPLTVERVRESIDDEVFMNHIVKRFNGWCLAHDASTANKQKALAFAQGKCSREELDSFEYTHDYYTTGRKSGEKKEAAIAALMKSLGLSKEKAEMVYALSHGKTVDTDAADDDEENE